MPDWLVSLPRLSWLAYAGNPYCELIEANALTQNPIGNIHWQHLDLQHRLGEGASGVIHQAEWQHEPQRTTEVAVKLFKGALTSDGLPHSEMAACISAGLHPNLIAVHGKISDHPADATGLVMSLIAPASAIWQPRRAWLPALATSTPPKPDYARHSPSHRARHRFRRTAPSYPRHHAWRFICP